ncbi:hypothetical protein AT727_25150 [Desulfitobacterium hafniense]|uniref:Uncharacterized protein n=1 Tax=Desulfitobacterium hafniense TaxID=49338 RepID=A0A0W1JN82_DESHA|nr:hypothetical protein AT727_25150 [Desulfitobacterium hafniense]
MGLAQGGGRERRLVERLEGLGQRAPELLLGAPPDVGERSRGHLVLQTRQLLGDLGRQHVQTRREELADLDHQPTHGQGERPEPDRRATVPARSAAVRPPLQPQPGQDELPEDEPRRHPGEERDDPAVPGT